MVYRCTQLSQHVIGQDYIQCGWWNTWSSGVDIACTGKVKIIYNMEGDTSSSGVDIACTGKVRII